MHPQDTTPIPDYPGYFITRDARIWSTLRRPGRWLVPFSSGTGYHQVSLCRDGSMKKERVHRLVLLAYIGLPAPGQEARHLDGNRTNNRLDNLAWGTKLENAADTLRHGTRPFGDRHGLRKHPDRVARGENNPARMRPERMARGEANGSAKLTGDVVREIRQLSAAGWGHRPLAARYGVSRSLVQKIVQGRIWRHVT